MAVLKIDIDMCRAFLFIYIHAVSKKTACNEDEDCGGDRICEDNGVGTGTVCCQPFEGMKILLI